MVKKYILISANNSTIVKISNLIATSTIIFLWLKWYKLIISGFSVPLSTMTCVDGHCNGFTIIRLETKPQPNSLQTCLTRLPTASFLVYVAEVIPQPFSAKTPLKKENSQINRKFCSCSIQGNTVNNHWWDCRDYFPLSKSVNAIFCNWRPGFPHHLFR